MSSICRKIARTRDREMTRELWTQLVRSAARTYLDLPAARDDARRLGDVLGGGRAADAIPIARFLRSVR